MTEFEKRVTRLDQIKERLSKTTPGEWPPILRTEDNIEFVRNSKPDISYLLEEVGNLQETIRKIREGLIKDGYQEINHLVELCDDALSGKGE